jgi:hypothetical protein
MEKTITLRCVSIMAVKSDESGGAQSGFDIGVVLVVVLSFSTLMR